MKYLESVQLLNYSGFDKNLKKFLPPLRKGYYQVIDIPVAGDAPKDFIRVYEFGEGIRKDFKKTWPAHIAKVGHKWYPIESVTEHMLNRIGSELGLNVAESRLMIAGNQVRFLSKYFLNPHVTLVHGAEIFAGYLGDREFVEEIENKGLARDYYTFEFAENAIKSMFPDQGDEIMQEFVKMLVLDAIIGNNDRHFYNWGVITHLRTTKIPTFAPIYDTARGLFWNQREEKVVEYFEHPKEIVRRLTKYADASQPKTGWNEVENINHFQLIGRIYHDDGRYKNICDELIKIERLEGIFKLIDTEFKDLMSAKRIELIKRCLSLRMEKLIHVLKP